MKFLGILTRLSKEHSKTILMVTHDPLAAERAQATLHLNKGVLVEGIATSGWEPGMKYKSLIIANLFRKKLRTTLTIGSFAVALFLFGFLAVVHGAFNQGVDVAGADRLDVINKTSIIQPLPLSYRDQILRIPGVKASYLRQLVWRSLSGRKEFFSAVRDRP